MTEAQTEDLTIVPMEWFYSWGWDTADKSNALTPLPQKHPKQNRRRGSS